MSSLLSLSYCAIKNLEHKKYATDVTIGQCVKLHTESLNIVQSKTIRKHIIMLFSDSMGSDVTFVLQKPNGKIIMQFHS